MSLLPTVSLGYTPILHSHIIFRCIAHASSKKSSAPTLFPKSRQTHDGMNENDWCTSPQNGISGNSILHQITPTPRTEKTNFNQIPTHRKPCNPIPIPLNQPQVPSLLPQTVCTYYNHKYLAPNAKLWQVPGRLKANILLTFWLKIAIFAVVLKKSSNRSKSSATATIFHCAAEKIEVEQQKQNYSTKNNTTRIKPSAEPKNTH